MIERILSPKEIQDREDAERLAEYLKMHPEKPAVPISKIENETRKEELERLVVEFESKYDLAELNAIEELSPALLSMFMQKEAVLTAEDARKFEIRTSAKKDLIPIWKLDGGKGKDYLRLSRAVGIINNGKIYHDRG